MEFLAPEPRPRIVDGFYEAQCVKYEYGQRPFPKLYLKFKITEPGEHVGRILFKPYNLPKKGKEWAHSSNFYMDWVWVNNFRQPSRNAKMSPRIFVNKIFKVRTRTTKPKRDGKEMPEQFWYSLVDSLVEVVA
jgi:hypothetical protein